MREYYQLESAKPWQQARYESLIDKLDREGVSSSRNSKTERREQPLGDLPDLILAYLRKGAMVRQKGVVDEFRHNWHTTTVKRALRLLTDKGLITRVSGRICLVSDAAPLDVDAPIVFLPRSKRSQSGVIVDVRELKMGAGGFHPVARLENGQELFVSSDVAVVDDTTTLRDQHRAVLLDWVKDAGDFGIEHNELCKKAFYAEIPHISKSIKQLVKAGLIKVVKRKGTPNMPAGTYYVLLQHQPQI